MLKKIQHFIKIFIKIRVITFFEDFYFFALKTKLAEDVFVFLNLYQTVNDQARQCQCNEARDKQRNGCTVISKIVRN